MIIFKGDDNDKIIPLVNQAINKVDQNKKAAIKIKDKGSYQVLMSIIGNSQQYSKLLTLLKKLL